MDANFKKLLASASEVRSKQKAYFALRRAGNVNAQSALEESKAAEKKLDALINQFQKEEQKQNQPVLFP